MPRYDFRCLNCQKRFDIFMTYAEYGNKEVACPHCASANITRKLNRVRVLRSDESRLQNMANPTSLAGLDDDPRTLGRMMREMSSQMGQNMGDEFHEVVNRLEAGQSPEAIEHDLPDLGADSMPGPGGDDF